MFRSFESILTEILVILCLWHSDIFTSWKWYWNLRFQWYYIRHKTGRSPISLGFSRISLRSNVTRHKANITEKSTCNSKCFFLGGRGWIRTTEVTDNRFTVCPLWPLGNSPTYKAYWNSRLVWSWWTDLNPRPADYKSAALPTELHQRISDAQL